MVFPPVYECLRKRRDAARRRIPSFSRKLLEAVLLVELVHAAAGVDQLLLAGVEGVALRADLDGDVLLGGSGLDDLAAGAADGRALVIGMDSFFHVVHLMMSCPEAEIYGDTRRNANYSKWCRAMQAFFALRKKVVSSRGNHRKRLRFPGDGF